MHKMFAASIRKLKDIGNSERLTPNGLIAISVNICDSKRSRLDTKTIKHTYLYFIRKRLNQNIRMQNLNISYWLLQHTFIG